MIIREMQREFDGERLSGFDTSFATDRVYRPVVDELAVTITEEKLAAVFHKTYAIDLIKNDLDEADYAFVAEIENTLAGFAAVKFEKWNNRMLLTGIFVAPSYKGKGVGRALVDEAVKYAKTMRARYLFAETQNVNYPAIRFYRKMGFQFCGFDNALYNPSDLSRPETAFYFCKSLSS